nr:MAG TPA: hypothetical protein [Caudoviricetes sp.]
MIKSTKKSGANSLPLLQKLRKETFNYFQF